MFGRIGQCTQQGMLNIYNETWCSYSSLKIQDVAYILIME